jgi:hypothetical protein
MKPPPFRSAAHSRRAPVPAAGAGRNKCAPVPAAAAGRNNRSPVRSAAPRRSPSRSGEPQSATTRRPAARETFSASTYSVLFRQSDGASGQTKAPPHAINENQNLIGLVNRAGVSIHHLVKCALNSRIAFILHERGPDMVNRCARRFAKRLQKPFRREPRVKSLLCKTSTSARGGNDNNVRQSQALPC